MLSSLAVGNRPCAYPCGCVRHFPLYSFQMVLSPIMVSFCIGMQGSVLSWILKERLCRSLEFLFQMHCPVNFSHLHLSSQTHISVSSIQGVCRLQPGFLFSELQPRRSLHAVSWSNHRPDLICFLSLRDPCPLPFKIFYLVYLVSGGGINPIPAPLFWLEAEVFSNYLKFPNYRCSVQTRSQNCIQEMENTKCQTRAGFLLWYTTHAVNTHVDLVYSAGL